MLPAKFNENSHLGSYSTGTELRRMVLKITSFWTCCQQRSQGLFALQKFDMTPKGTCNLQGIDELGLFGILAENSKNMP